MNIYVELTQVNLTYIYFNKTTTLKRKPNFQRTNIDITVDNKIKKKYVNSIARA